MIFFIIIYFSDTFGQATETTLRSTGSHICTPTTDRGCNAMQVRITGVHWPASDSWTRTSFLKRFGQTEFDVAPVPYASLYGGFPSTDVKSRSDPNGGTQKITAAQFVTETMGRKRSAQPRYIFDSRILWRTPSLASDLPLPWLDDAHIILKQFIMGPRGSGAYPHFHNAAINALAHGRKRWYVALAYRKMQSVFEHM